MRFRPKFLRLKSIKLLFLDLKIQGNDFLVQLYFTIGKKAVYQLNIHATVPHATVASTFILSMLKIEPEIFNFCHFKMVLNVFNSRPSSFPLTFVWPLSRHSVRVNVVRFCSKRSLKGSQWFNTSKNHSKFPVIPQPHQI